jgi:hypothetical protein
LSLSPQDLWELDLWEQDLWDDLCEDLWEQDLWDDLCEDLWCFPEDLSFMPEEQRESM